MCASNNTKRSHECSQLKYLTIKYYVYLIAIAKNGASDTDQRLVIDYGYFKAFRVSYVKSVVFNRF